MLDGNQARRSNGNGGLLDRGPKENTSQENVEILVPDTFPYPPYLGQFLMRSLLKISESRSATRMETNRPSAKANEVPSQ